MAELAYGNPGTSGEFRIGAVLGRTFEVLGKDLGRILLLAAVSGLPMLALVLSELPYAPSTTVFWLAMVLQMVLGFLVQGAVVHGAFQRMRGQRFSLAESVGRCLRRFGPLLGSALLASVGIIAGCIALLVPGLIAMTAWLVVAPACVIERLGPSASLSRSAILTRGYRWKVFALVAISSIGAVVTTALVSLVVEQVGGAVAQAWAEYIAQLAWGGLDAVLAAVVYHDLRSIKEGLDLDQIAGIFE